METMTPKKLQKFVQDYDYEITLEQSRQIIEVLDETYGVFGSMEIEMATDYIVNGKESIFASYF